MTTESTKPADVGFNFAEVLSDLGELRQSLRNDRAAALERYASRVQPDAAMSGDRVRAVRESLGLAPSPFAAFLGVPMPTVRAWEAGTERPTGTARRFLEEIAAEPSHFRTRVASLG